MLERLIQIFQHYNLLNFMNFDLKILLSYVKNINFEDMINQKGKKITFHFTFNYTNNYHRSPRKCQLFKPKIIILPNKANHQFELLRQSNQR